MSNEQFAWLEKIENGTLVHYAIVVKHRMKAPTGPFPQSRSDDDDFIEVHTLGKRTVYCKDLNDVFVAIGSADAAREEIEKLRRDGKLSAQHNVMNILNVIKGFMGHE